MAKSESDRLAETTPIYADMRKEGKWEIPRIELPKVSDHPDDDWNEYKQLV